jgi:hypothetical protein
MTGGSDRGHIIDVTLPIGQCFAGPANTATGQRSLFFASLKRGERSAERRTYLRLAAARP